MKTLLFTLFCASMAFAKPVSIEGTWGKTKKVLPMARIHYVIAGSSTELAQLKQYGYTCKKLDARQICNKLATRNFELPVEVQARLWEMAFTQISFSRSSGDYSLVNESETLKEWSKDQVVEIDKLRFETLTWRELIDKNQITTRMVLSSDRHDQKADIVVVGQKDLGVVVKLRVNNQKGWNEYWGVVRYALEARN